VRRTRALALVAVSVLALAAPAIVAASGGEHYAHPYFHVRPTLNSTSPRGLSPATIKAAYSFSTSTGAGVGKTIAIVDAYDDPTAKADLDWFNQTFGLPVFPTCGGSVTTTCFQKVNQTGGSAYPRTNAGWALEIALDVEWAHAIAPGAKILLVEATTNSFTNLLAAEGYANGHADYVSNSWGSSEFSGENSNDSSFAAGKAFVSSGDAGLPAEYPSSSPNVISVGGTTLHFDSSGNFTGETGWSGGGGGCSTYESATTAQLNFAGTVSQPGYSQVNCGGQRATPDVSLDADPASGVSVYDTTRYQGITGWFTVGGTSASSPMTAGHAAVVGASTTSAYIYTTLAWSAFRDITSGSNGASCLAGFDLCSGRGSWHG
jgi:subtilase family serine protease